MDNDRIEAMLTWGAPVRIVAERLGCSQRHVRRVRQERSLSHNTDPMWGTEWERTWVWGIMLNLDYSDAQIAFRTGRSRQAVAQWRKKEEERERKQKSADPENWQHQKD